jgi:hypothetical protein
MHFESLLQQQLRLLEDVGCRSWPGRSVVLPGGEDQHKKKLSAILSINNVFWPRSVDGNCWFVGVFVLLIYKACTLSDHVFHDHHVHLGPARRRRPIPD